MAYRIAYKRSITRDLKHLPKEEQRRILNKIEKELTADPSRHTMLKGKFAGLRRLRVESFRVIYTILEDEVLILRIGLRKDVYR